MKDVLRAFGVSTAFEKLGARKGCAGRGFGGIAGAGTQTGARVGAETSTSGLPLFPITTATHSREGAASAPLRAGHTQPDPSRLSGNLVTQYAVIG